MPKARRIDYRNLKSWKNNIVIFDNIIYGMLAYGSQPNNGYFNV